MAGEKQKKKKKIKRDLRTLQTVLLPRAEEVKKSMCSYLYCVSLAKTLALILFYYTFSITLTFYNQHFIHEYQLPLSFTMAHLIFKFIVSGIIRWIVECRTGEERIMLGWKEYCKRVALTGVVSSLDIGLSNWSFDFITVSLYTMSKSSAVIFVMGFALLFRLERCRFLQVFVVLFIATGLFMFTYQSTQFNLEGFIMVMSASFLSGLRWTLAQTLLQKQEMGLHNPLDMMYHIQPWMMLTLLPITATAEGLKISSTDLVFRATDIELLTMNVLRVLAGAVLAFFLEFSEFLLVSNTSSLTLSVSGIFKELCVLLLAVCVNGDKVSPVNGLGLLVCVLGIALHVVLKAVYARQDREEEMVRVLNQAEESVESVEMLMQNGNPTVLSDIEEEEGEEEDIFNISRDR